MIESVPARVVHGSSKTCLGRSMSMHFLCGIAHDVRSKIMYIQEEGHLAPFFFGDLRCNQARRQSNAMHASPVAKLRLQALHMLAHEADSIKQPLACGSHALSAGILKPLPGCLLPHCTARQAHNWLGCFYQEGALSRCRRARLCLLR